MKRTLAIIPARGNSKGLKNKNIYPLNNKELIAYTIEAAKNSKYITDVYVNSDSEEILNIAQRYQAMTYKREIGLALDDTLSQDVVYDMLCKLDQKYDTIILLQPTSPLRDTSDIDAAFELFYNCDAHSLISMSVPKHSPLKAFTLNRHNYLTGIVNNEYPFMPRQKLPKTYYPNGAIYIFKHDIFLQTKEFFSDKTVPYIMGDEKSIDIDTLQDITKVEELMNKKGITIMQNVQDQAIQNYQDNIEYFEQNHEALFYKIKALETVLEDGRYPQKYDLEYKENYFDVIELKNKNFLYNQNSNKLSNAISDTITFKKNEHVFETFYNYKFTEKALQKTKEAKSLIMYAHSAELIDYHDKNTTKTDTL